MKNAKEIPIDILKRDWPEMYKMVFDYALLTGNIVKPLYKSKGIYEWRGEIYSPIKDLYYGRIGMKTGVTYCRLPL